MKYIKDYKGKLGTYIQINNKNEALKLLPQLSEIWCGWDKAIKVTGEGAYPMMLHMDDSWISLKHFGTPPTVAILKAHDFYQETETHQIFN